MCNLSPTASCLQPILTLCLALLLASPASGDVVDPHGDLAVVSGQPFAGRFSVAITVDDGDRVYLVDDSPQGLDTYRARFLWSYQDLAMVENDQVTLLTGLTETPTSQRILALVLRLADDSQERELQLKARDDAGVWRVTWWTSIPAATGSESVTIAWHRSSSTTANDGLIRLWIGDVLFAKLEGLDNSSWPLDSVRFGMVSAPPQGTRGVLRFDSFESWSR